MPSHSHSSSSSSGGRQSQRSSKHASTSSTSEKLKDRDTTKRSSINAHSRTKSKSSSVSLRPSPREESTPFEHASFLSPLSPTTAEAAAGVTARVQRPALKSRALSAPMVPNATLHHQSLEHGGDIPEYGEDFIGHGDLGDGEIADDPFFQRYSSPHNGDEEQEDEVSARIDSVLSATSMVASSQSRPDSNVEPLSPSSPQSPRYWNSSQASRTQLQEVNIAVVGAARVGKSTFIKQALDLEEMPATPFTSRKVQMDGTVYVVRLIEINYGDLDLDDEKCICWPDTVGNTPVPHIDGAFTLYDVTCKDSLLQVPETLSGLYNAQIPFLLVACKCDHSPGLTPVDPDRVDAGARAHIGSIRTLRTSEAAPDTQKRCVAVLLRAIAVVRTQQLNNAPNRRRANSSAMHPAQPTPQPLSRHNRANSEMSMTMFRGHPRSRYRLEANSSLGSRSQSHQTMPMNGDNRAYAEPLRSPAYTEDDGEELEMRARPARSNTGLVGESFEELVGRLLSLPRKKLDHEFASIFLALYRLFASPGQLLDTILKSFDVLGSNSIPQMLKVKAQERHLEVLEQWTSHYPGDFAHPYSHSKLENFVNKIANTPLFASAAQELAGNLEAMVEDDDTDWALCDRDRSNVPSKMPLKLVTNGLTSLTLTTDSASQTPVSPLALGLPHVSSTQSLLSFVENATRQAVHLIPQPRFSLSKLQWRLLMDQPEDMIAKEMTRMDWTMFCSIRPRDLVRDVTLNESGKAQCRSLENVQRMIDHFNHVALWTVNFILLRDKAKHRSFMLEKMMKIARELRRMNNYNSLGAVVAGINNSAVHRLHVTKELIDPAIGKKFLTLDILMSSQKSHATYRLAWDNTSGERIPYLPLHRRDLVAASEGNRTFVGGESDSKVSSRVDFRERMINWKKFEVMGQVVIGLQKAKDVPYPSLNRSDEIKSLLIDLNINHDEERLYERSKTLETSAGEARERRFGWPKR